MHRGPESGRAAECGGMPRGEQRREKRKREGAENRSGPDVVALGRGGTAAQSDCCDPCTSEKKGDLGAARQEKCERQFIIGEFAHGQLSFRPFGMRRARRSNSSGEIRTTSPPRSAATTFSVEPSKNVSTRWRSAERRATSRGTAGT